MKSGFLLKRRTWLLITGALTALCGMANAAHAQSADTQWQSAFTLYGYFPSIHGESTFPNGSLGPSFRIDAHSIIKNLNFAFMGKFSIRKDRWGAFADFFYADLGDSVSATRHFNVSGIPVPVGVTGDFKLRSKATLLTLAGTWQFVAEPDHDMRFVFGARMDDNRQRLDWRLSAPLIASMPLSGQSKISKTDWDAIVGISGRQRFGRDLRWFMPYYVDMGTGESHFTGQALLGIGYAFDWGEATAGWRYIDYEFKSGNLISKTSFSGPAVGVTWRF